MLWVSIVSFIFASTQKNAEIGMWQLWQLEMVVHTQDLIGLQPSFQKLSTASSMYV